MTSRLLAAGGLAAALLAASAPAAHAGCVDDAHAHAYGYYYVYESPDDWVTVNGLNVGINGQTAVSDTNWNVFVTRDYAGYWVTGAGNFVNCVV